MVDPYKGTRFEGFTGLGNDGYGSISQGPMDNILADGFFVNDPRRPRPGMRGSSNSGISAVPTMDGTELTNVPSTVGRILADRNMTPEERARSPIFAQNPGGGPDRDDFYAFKSTLRDPGDMGRYIAPGEEMSYEDFVKFGRPANLAAASSAGYSTGLNPIKSLAGVTPEEALKGGGLLPNSGFSGNLEGTAEAGGILGSGADVYQPGGGLVPGSGAVGGILPNVVKDPNPINYYMGRPTNMTTDAEIANFEAVNNPNPMQDPLAPLPSNKKLVDGKIVDNGNPLVAPDMTQRPMPFSGLASLTKLPMFQEFATKLESEHPEASQLFSQMFMGSSQRPMPFQNPFMGMGMGMGMGSFHPMMGGMGMGMGGYNPMMGMGGGFNPMMGGMGMGGYSPFMGMNPMMGMGGGFNPMMGMSGGGLGSFYPQPSTYGPPQSMPSMGGYPTPPQSSPFGGAMRGYYA